MNNGIYNQYRNTCLRSMDFLPPAEHTIWHVQQ